MIFFLITIIRSFSHAVVKQEWGEIDYWSIVNAVTTLAHDGTDRSSLDEDDHPVRDHESESSNKQDDILINTKWSVKTFVSKMFVAP